MIQSISMPAKNRIKPYLEESYYHIYNRGVEKRIIFTDQKDYRVFLSYLKTYLLPPPPITIEAIYPSRQLKNYADHISLHAYCLMPNHFHILVKQAPSHAINKFIQSLTVKYTMYFNRRHSRVGGLFQGRYKAVLVDTDSQLLYLTKYIHTNPTSGPDPEVYPYSSYRNYLNKINQAWVKPKPILDYFSSKNPSGDYQAFINDTDSYGLDDTLTLDNDTSGSGLEV